MPVSEKGKSSLKSEAYPDVMMQTEAKLVSLSRKGRLGKNGSSENSAEPGVEPTSLPADCVGFGLSGGGIRSATFCLGFFQGLAKLGLLRKIDFLSTVSGGGYFGSFYTRLFTRKEVDGIDFVENVLDRQGAGKRAEEKKNRPGEEAKPSRLDSGSVFRWLRENGRYLSPNGSGDLLLGGAVLLRNLLAIHIVLGVFFLFQFLLGQGIRTCIAMFTWGRWEGLWKKLDFELIARFPGELFVWVSPFGIFALALLVFWAGPCGWAYWLVGALPQEEQDTNPLLQTIKVRAPFFSLIAIFVAALVTALWPGETGVGSYWQDFLWNPRRFLSTGVVGVAVGALVLVKLANKRAQMLFALEVKKAEKSNVPPENNGLGKYEELFKDNLGRNWLSERLKVALVAVMAVFLYAVIDSFGQTLYLLMKGSADQMKDKSTLVSWIGGVWAALLALSPYVTRIAKALGWSESDTRPSGLKNALLAAVALALAGFILVTFNIASHAIAWKLQRPPVAMKVSKKAPTPARLELTFALVGLAGGDGQKIKYAESSPSVTKEGPAIKAARSKGVLFLTLAFTLVLSILFGHSWPFVNRSSHLPLYSARLIRAYLGASNPLRHDRKRKDGAVTRVMVGDDINTHDYWPWPNPDGEKKDPSSLFKKGTPLHLINVTINETIDGESQIQQQDRKGVGMALGPSGISAGVRHHVVFHEEEGSKEEKEGGRQTAKEQKTTVFPPENDEFRMFDLHKGVFQGERHPIGHWLAISGAAFSTGLGSRTSLGLSLLTGIGNIRLGFWWNSGFDRKKMEENRAEKKREEMKRASAAETSPGEERNKNKKEKPEPARALLGALVEKVLLGAFPVQAHLLDEFSSRFPGCARRYWYLSDGGHFENLGGYELIRRRLPLMVILDAEADPDYTFSGLADLIRKARLDFGAEIIFLDEKELKGLFGEQEQHFFGTLSDLRRGKWEVERRPENRWPWSNKGGVCIEESDRNRFSSAHGAIAKVQYSDKGSPDSWLIYVKPTLVGEESADLLQYHGDNPSFPQESTADQFFDEAQWESYRKLGEHIATVLLHRPPAEEKVKDKKGKDLVELKVPSSL